MLLSPVVIFTTDLLVSSHCYFLTAPGLSSHRAHHQNHEESYSREGWRVISF